jgi:hypothetical protein
MPPLPSDTISFGNSDDTANSSDILPVTSSMDVDPSPTSSKTVLESIPESNPVVCLPYSLVPGLDITSQSYQKAVITLGKQQATPVSTPERVPLISILDRGAIFLHHVFFSIFSNF